MHGAASIVWVLVGELCAVSRRYRGPAGEQLGRSVVSSLFRPASAAISEFFMIPYYPIWSIIMLVLYVALLVAFIRKRSGPTGTKRCR